MDAFIDFYEAAKHRDIFVILGPQGSGTNLLARLMTRAFDFSVVRDKSFIFKSAVKIHHQRDPRQIQKHLRRVCDSIFSDTLASKAKKQQYSENFVGIDKYIDQVRIESARDFAYFFYAYHAYINGKTRFSIKSDDIWENIEYIDQILDSRKIVLLTRDCRDNVLSIMNKNFGPKNVYSGSHYVKKRLSVYYQELLKNRENSIQVNYESLLKEPKSFIHDFAKQFDMLPVDDIEAIIQTLNIRASNSQKWKKAMNDEELSICESILHDELLAFHYPLHNTEFPTLSQRQILGHRVSDCALRVPQKVKRTYHKLFVE